MFYVEEQSSFGDAAVIAAEAATGNSGVNPLLHQPILYWCLFFVVAGWQSNRDAKAELNRRSQVCDVLTGTGISRRKKLNR